MSCDPSSSGPLSSGTSPSRTSPSDALPPRRAATPGPAFALALCCALAAAGCGHKKSPTPPPSKIPQRVTLSAHQRGSEAILEFPFPTMTISGTSLPGISRIEIWRFGMEVPEFALELLAEEDARREEAQDLLDELGLDLYETPVGLPGEDGAPSAGELPAGADATGVPPPAFPLQDPAGDKAREEGIPGAAAVETAAGGEDAADDTAEDDTLEDGTLEDGTLEDDTLDDGTLEDGTTSAGEGDADDDDALEGGAPGEDGTGEELAGEGDAAAEGGAEEGADVELTAEEELALRVEAARNLLRSPVTPKSSFIAATAKDFKKGAELVLAVDAEEISTAVVGDLVVLRIPLPPRAAAGPELGYLFAAKIFALNGKPSDLSNTAGLLPEESPPAPRDVKVEAQPDGVALEWRADEEPRGGFRIYRRDAQARAYGAPLATVPGTLYSGDVYTYVDRLAVFGARYIYGVTALASATPLLESDLSSEHEVDYQDRFGPAVPGGLVAFPEAGRVRLLWTPVADPDLAGYEVRRRARVEDDPVTLSEQPVTGSQYLDEAVTSGEVWLYSVVSVDESGNRSEPGLEVQVRVP